MTDKRMVAVSIGVSDARPLPFLPGALNGALGFHEWSKALGYEATLITDSDEPVTIYRLTTELEAILSTAPAIDRFVLYFAGHGVIREAEDGLWLLSDWRTRLKGVQYEVLKRRLAMFGVKQVAIFADACRSLPPDILVSDLDGDAVVGAGPNAHPVMPPVDKFIATQDGDTTFSVPGATEGEDRCLFSGVLLEGLWGFKPNAFSESRTTKVTSTSLASYLETEVPQRAAYYKAKSRVVPNVFPTFREGSDVYFEQQPGSALARPVLAPWPAPPPAPAAMRSADAYRALSPVPAKATPGDLLRDKILAQSVPESPQASQMGTGFVIDGASVAAIWTNQSSMAEHSSEAGWFRIGALRDARASALDSPSPVLIELLEGGFVAATALPHFIGSVLVEVRTTLATPEPISVSALVYRNAYGEGRDLLCDLEVTARALGHLEGGGLRATAITDLATDLRRTKHADPVLGVISAYLYDSIGDVDSIRRMAYAYVEHGQAIPYDIALLGQLQGYRLNDLLCVSVPAVAARKPRSNTEASVNWTTAATPAANGIVAGLWPWMRQGWTFLAHPDDSGSTLVMPGLIELIPHLGRSRFAALDVDGGKRLAQLFNLQKT